MHKISAIIKDLINSETVHRVQNVKTGITT